MKDAIVAVLLGVAAVGARYATENIVATRWTPWIRATAYGAVLVGSVLLIEAASDSAMFALLGVAAVVAIAWV
jgi:hypothetical protein